MKKQYTVFLHFWTVNDARDKVLAQRVLEDASNVKEIYSWIRNNLVRDLSCIEMQVIALAGKLDAHDRIELSVGGISISIVRHC